MTRVYYPGYGGIFMGKDLQTLNGQNVKDWCKENGICERTYYRWQKRLFEIAKAQQEVPFADVTSVQRKRNT